MPPKKGRGRPKGTAKTKKVQQVQIVRPRRQTLGSRIYRYSRQMFVKAITASDLNTSRYWDTFTFQLNLLPNYTEFTALYDQYKIDMVKLYIIPTFSDLSLANPPASGDPILPRVASTIDLDDDAVFTSEDQLLQKQDIKWTSGGKLHKRKVYPKVQMAAYDTALSFGYVTPKMKPWLDCSYPDTKHYGLKIQIDGTGTPTVGTAWMYRVYAKYFISFRTVR